MQLIDEYRRPRYQPEILDAAYADPDTLRRLVATHGPYACMSGQPGYDGFGLPPMPWFRVAWSGNDADDDEDLNAVFHNPAFLDASKRVFEAEIVRPSAIVLNLMGPMPAGAAHLDAPTFRGLGRGAAPVWLLSVMGSTGLFSRWAVPVAAALTWVYERAGDGAYEFWPDGPSEPRSSVTAPFANHALVGDNDYMFHRVAPIGDAEKWLLAQRFSIHARLEYRGDTACVVDGDEVAVTYNTGEVRASLLWRGLTFADADDERRFDEHLDDLDLGTIERVFRDDLGAHGRQAPEPSGIATDPAWMTVLNDTYGYTSPDVS
jgi:hypothetical protein